MDELKNLIKEKAGVTDEQAAKALEIMAAYVKERVPGIIHGQLDKIFAGKHLEDSIRDQAGELGNEVKERAEGLAKDLKEAFEGAFKTKKT